MRNYTLIYAGAKFHVYLPEASSECYEHICTGVENDPNGDDILILYEREDGKTYRLGAGVCHLESDCPFEYEDRKIVVNKKPDLFPALSALKRAVSLAIIGKVGFSATNENPYKILRELAIMEHEHWRMKTALQFYASEDNEGKSVSRSIAISTLNDLRK